MACFQQSLLIMFEVSLMPLLKKGSRIRCHESKLVNLTILELTIYLQDVRRNDLLQLMLDAEVPDSEITDESTKGELVMQ